MTDRGLLEMPGAVSTNWMAQEALTTQVVFEEVYEDGQDDSDYHNTMNGAKFIAWVRFRLLPTFKAMFPGKRMWLIMDNASYHKPRDETWISTSKGLNKATLADELIGRGVTSLMTIGASPHLVPAELFTASTGNGGCTKADLIAALQEWLEDHPGHNRSVVEQLFDGEDYKIVYTPPYCPEVQPIELLWARIKRHAADCAHLGRSVDECREDTEDAFEAITSMFCNSIITHCHDWIDKFLQSEEAEDLRQCGSLRGVIRNAHLLRLAADRSQVSQPMEIDVPPALPPPARPAAARCARGLRPRR